MARRLLLACVAGIGHYNACASEAGDPHATSTHTDCDASLPELTEDLLVHELATSLLQYSISPIEVNLDAPTQLNNSVEANPHYEVVDALPVAGNGTSLVAEKSSDDIDGGNTEGAFPRDTGRLRLDSGGKSVADLRIASIQNASDDARRWAPVQALIMSVREALSPPARDGTYAARESWGDILEHIADDPRELQTLRALRKFQREANEAKRFSNETQNLAAIDASVHSEAAVGGGLTETILLIGCGMVVAAFMVLAYHNRWDWQHTLDDVQKDPQLLYKQFEEEGKPCC